MLSDEWLPRYRLLENFTAKWNGNGNGNVYDRGDYNSSFALRAVELKTTRIVRGSDYSPAIALSEDKDIFWGISLFEKLMACNNPDLDLININVYTKFG